MSLVILIPKWILEEREDEVVIAKIEETELPWATYEQLRNHIHKF